jgi:hypothetical protein
VAYKVRSMAIKCGVGLNLHIIGPFRVSVVEMERIQWTDIMRLPIIIPGDDFQELRTQSEDLVPAVEPQKI